MILKPNVTFSIHWSRPAIVSVDSTTWLKVPLTEDPNGPYVAAFISDDDLRRLAEECLAVLARRERVRAAEAAVA